MTTRYVIFACVLLLSAFFAWSATGDETLSEGRHVAVWFVVFAFVLLLRAFFAGYETGFVSLSRIRIRHLSEKEHMARATHLLGYIRKPDQMLAMLLIGTNLATIIGTMALSRGMRDLSATYGDLLATVVATAAFLLISEIIPKSIFRTHPNRLSLGLLPVARFFHGVFMPVTWPVAMATRILFRATGVRQNFIAPPMSSVEDVRSLVDESADQGTIEPEERRMIHSVMDLQTTQAKEIMVPRIDIQAVADTATREELLALFAESGRTRIPVYHDSIDSVIGVVNAHDVLLDRNPGDPDIKRFVGDVSHVPDTIPVDDLLQDLRTSKQHLAIVVDEYGGTDGLITIEDILEEIFGEIQDEHDSEESPIRQVAPGAYVVDARMPIEEAATALGIDLYNENVETIGGLVTHVAGKIPAQGEVLEDGGLRMTVLAAGASHVEKVRIEVLGKAKESDAKKA